MGNIITPPNLAEMPKTGEHIPPNFKNMARDARIVLCQRTYNLSFFGNLSYKFDWHFCELDPNCGGFIKLNLETGLSSDGIIYINTHFAGQPGFNQNNLVGLVLHEILHQLNKHSVRQGQREPQLWNIAADHCCDRDLKKLGNFCPRPNGQYNIIDELDKLSPECTAEQAYAWLLKEQEKKGNGKNGQPRFQVSFNSQSGMIKVKDNSTGKEWDVNGQTQDLTSEEAKNLKARIEQFCAEARAIYQSCKQKGSTGNNVSEYLDKILQPEIPWQSLLEMAIKTNVIIRPDDRSWRKINPYYRHLGVTLPGATMIEDHDGVGRLVVSVDTSGSIGTKELAEFSGVIMQSMKYFEIITLLVHDVEIHQIKDFTKDNIIEFEEWVKKEGYQGRGGTSHRYIFDHVEKEIWDDRDERDMLSMVISLTDGYSDIQENYIKYKWINSQTPLVFIITGDWTCDFKDHRNIKVINMKTEK